MRVRAELIVLPLLIEIISWLAGLTHYLGRATSPVRIHPDAGITERDRLITRSVPAQLKVRKRFRPGGSAATGFRQVSLKNSLIRTVSALVSE